MSVRRVLCAAAALLLVPLGLARPMAAPPFSDWSTPLNVGGVVNSQFDDFGPAVSKDGLSLYFTSNRPGGMGTADIWVSQRASRADPWGEPVNLGPNVNTASNDGAPAISRDEHWMFFNSGRSGGFGGNDIWASYREHTKDALGWQPPVNLGPSVNSAYTEQGPGYLENDDGGPALLFFASDRPGGMGSTDVYVCEVFPDGSLGPANLVPELNSPAPDNRPSIRFDGLEVFFASNSLPNVDLWVATRQTLFDLWSTPTNLGLTVNSTAADQQPYIAADRQTLYFASNRAGGFGGLDLYVTTRTRRQP